MGSKINIVSKVVGAGRGGGNWASVGYIGKERFNYSFNDCNGLGISAQCNAVDMVLEDI